MRQTIDRYAVGAFIPLAIAAVAIGVLVAWRTGRSRGPLVLLGLALAAIVAIALGGRMIELSSWAYVGVHLDWLVDGEQWRQVLDVDGGSVFNVALFVPAGATLTWVTSRMAASVLTLVAFSLVIEVVQRAWLLGAPDVRDVFANALGAVVGGGGAVALRRAGRVRVATLATADNQ